VHRQKQRPSNNLQDIVHQVIILPLIYPKVLPPVRILAIQPLCKCHLLLPNPDSAILDALLILKRADVSMVHPTDRLPLLPFSALIAGLNLVVALSTQIYIRTNNA
jgi:hypothetical protein